MSSGVLTDIGLVLISVSLLWKGGDWVVLSALRIARRLDVSDVVIGLTVVALGTSAPEIVVTLITALSGHHDISVGNVVGSNIFNIGFILGGCAAARAIPTTRYLVLRDGSILLLGSVLVLFLLYDSTLSRGEGMLMVTLLVTYLVYLMRHEEEPAEEMEEDFQVDPGRGIDFFFLCAALGCVIGGAHLLVQAASSLALAIGLSEWEIAVTIVAGGTSLPELSTAIAAARRGRSAIMAATLIGSSLFNLLGVLGLAAFLHPLTIVDTAQTSLFMMAGMFAFMVVFMRSGWRLSRIEGALLVGMAALRWSSDLAPAFWTGIF
ncbi:MAG: calcium/sodium antiporter [bacterium]|nr:calcium/sodium antiporter [bacterium]